MSHHHLCTTHPHLSTHLQLLPQFLDWICLKKRKRKMSISSLLIHQHHPPPDCDVSLDVSSSGPPQLQTASINPTSDVAIILHPEPSRPPQGMPIPVNISKGIPPQLMSDTGMDEEFQHPDHPIEDGTKEEGGCTDEDDQDMPPLVDVSTDEAQTKEFPPDPWNDSAFTLQERLDQIRWESL